MTPDVETVKATNLMPFTWLAELLDLAPTAEDFAIVCVVEATGAKRSYVTTDIGYAQMLAQAVAAGPVDLMPDIAAHKLPLHRDGWPGQWLGFTE